MFFKARPPLGMGIDAFLSLGRIVSAAVSGARKAVLAQVRGVERSEDDPKDGESSSDEPMFGQVGVVVRPRSSTSSTAATGLNPEGYAEIVGARFGDRFAPIAGRDLRLNMRVNPSEGEVDLVGYGGGFLSLADAADLRGTTAVLYAPRLDSSGAVEKANAIALDPDQGSISIVQQDGTAFVLTETGAITRSPTGAAFVELSDNQHKVSAPAAFTYTGSWQVYVPNAAQTQAHTVLVDDSTGSIQIIHRTGAAIVFNDAGDIVFRTKTGRLMTFNDDGLFLDGTLKVRGSGFFGNPLEWNVPKSAVLTGLLGIQGVPSTTLFASLTPPLPI